MRTSRNQFRALLGAATALAAFAATTPAFALLVQPVVIRMGSSGTNTSAAITVINDRNVPDTIEISVAKLTLPQKGAPVLTPDKGDDFLIFPPIATVAPGKTQVFRIRWVGEPVLAEAKTYMFTTSEIPVNQTKTTGVQLIYAIQSLVTVTSPNLKSDVSALSATRAVHTFPGTDGQPARTEAGLNVTFANTGDDDVLLSDYKFRLEVAGPKPWSKTIDSADVSKYLGLGLLTPNSKRELFMSVADIPATGDIKLTLTHDSRR